MKRALTLIILALLVAGCSSKHDGSTKPSSKLPSKAALIFPDSNAVCITGTGTTDSQSNVPFSWHSSANTNSYTLVITNLLTNVSTDYQSVDPGISATLLLNTPYSWYVVSKSSSTSAMATSNTWKFYNSGPGVSSHAPFPATLLTPTFAQIVSATAGQVNLTWHCDDVDADLASYDVYFGSTSTPPLLQAGVTASNLAVNVTSGTIYYWSIVAKDSKGNTSNSDVFQFKVN